MEQLRVDPEFQALIPPLSADERAQLQKNLLADGCRDPLVAWDGILLDGHNRRDICTEHGLPFRVTAKEFDSRDAAKVWMIDNQKGRRNLLEWWQYELAQIKATLLEDIGRANQRLSQGRGVKGLSNLDKPFEPHNTQKEIAADLGWSTGKLARADVVKSKAKPEVIDQIKKGELSIHKAYDDVRKEEKAVKLATIREGIKQQTQSLPTPAHIEIADALDWLPRQEPADLLLTDPPFMTDVPDIGAFARSWLPLALDRVKPTGRAYVFVGAYPEELAAYMAVRMPTQILVWTYRNTLGPSPKMRYKLNWQAVLYYEMPAADPLDCPIMTEQFTVQDINAPDGRQGDRFHAWQKPMQIAEQFIRHSTKQGGAVIDPFACTGTFLLAAAKLGRSGRGCEIDADNIEIARSRGVQ